MHGGNINAKDKDFPVQVPTTGCHGTNTPYRHLGMFIVKLLLHYYRMVEILIQRICLQMYLFIVLPINST